MMASKLSSFSSVYLSRVPGYHGDLNETYAVGEIDDDAKKLIRTTRECLDEAIKLCKPGALFRDLGKAMQVPPGSVNLVFVDIKLSENPSRVPTVVQWCDPTRVTVSMTFSTPLQYIYRIMPRTKPSEP